MLEKAAGQATASYRPMARDVSDVVLGKLPHTPENGFTSPLAPAAPSRQP